MVYDLLVCSGRDDPNTDTILEAAESRSLSVCKVVPDAETEPSVTWDPVFGRLSVDGEAVRARGVFLRYDVFGPGGYAPDQGKTDRALAWFSTLSSWAFTDPQVRMFNRLSEQRAAYKGYALARAAALGVPIPATLLSNARGDIEALGGSLIAKPAGGGAYTSEYGEIDEQMWGERQTAPAPAIVQERLDYPEYRVYLVGGAPFVFETHADTLDFRADRESRTVHVPSERLGGPLLDGLQRLAVDLRLDFCAYDLKTRASTGELCYLEVNSGPMFTAFDTISDGALAGAMVDWLVAGEAAKAMAAE